MNDYNIEMAEKLEDLANKLRTGEAQFIECAYEVSWHSITTTVSVVERNTNKA